MKKNSLIVTAAFLVALGFVETAAVTHTIINKSGRAIEGLLYYRGRVDFLKSCRPDAGLIQPDGGTLVSRAGGCLLEYVQIKDGDKLIRLKVANASATIAKAVGLTTAYVLLAVAIIAAADDGHPIYVFPPYELSLGRGYSITNELIVYAGTSTVWEYDGVSLVPKIGVKAYGRHDFTKSN